MVFQISEELMKVIRKNMNDPNMPLNYPRNDATFIYKWLWKWFRDHPEISTRLYDLGLDPYINHICLQMASVPGLIFIGCVTGLAVFSLISYYSIEIECPKCKEQYHFNIFDGKCENPSCNWQGPDEVLLILKRPGADLFAVFIFFKFLFGGRCVCTKVRPPTFEDIIRGRILSSADKHLYQEDKTIVSIIKNLFLKVIFVLSITIVIIVFLLCLSIFFLTLIIDWLLLI